MKMLAVDTATSRQSVAVLEDDTILAQVDRDAEGSHAKWLLLSIDQALQTAGLHLHDMHALALSIGPGSFTGLRVGLATMLGFRSVMGVPFVAVPTLEAMAWNARLVSGAVCPILKSRKNEVYWAVFEWLADHRLCRHVSEQVGAPASLACSIERPITAFGDGWETYASEIRNCLGPRTHLVTDPPSATAPYPTAANVGLAGRQRLERGDIAGMGVAPLYIQRCEAEMKYEANGRTSPRERLERRLSKRKSGKRGAPSGSRKR